MADDLLAIIGAFSFLVVALLTILFGIRVAKIENSAVLIGLLIIPVVIYLVLSGRLSELKGPGGMEAKFVNAMNQPLRITTRSIEKSLKSVQITQRGTIDQLPDVMKMIDKSKPVILTIRLGESYFRNDWLIYMNAILDKVLIAYVAIVDDNDHLIAYMSVSDVRYVLDRIPIGEELIRLIKEGSAEEIKRIPGVQTDFVLSTESAIDVLQQMDKKQSTSVVILDENRKILGIARKEDVTAQIVLDIASIAGGDGRK